jgi:Domain of unknown function (DUF1841)
MADPDADPRARRLAFAIPPIDRLPDGLDAELLDPTDPDDRAMLLRAAHPELDTKAEQVLVDGREVNPRLHLVLHEVVASQLAADDPPEVWATATRLRGLGYGRHEILHMLGSAMSGELWEAIQGHRGYDIDAHRAALAALPESWERERPGGPATPAGRAAHDAEARKRRKAARTARRRNRRR